MLLLASLSSHPHGMRLDVSRYVSLLRQCSKTKDLQLGRRVHVQIVEDGYEQKTMLGNLLVQMYGKCSCVREARLVFDGIEDKDGLSWNMMVSAYAQNGYLHEAREVFERTPEKQISSWNIIMTAYVKNNAVLEAKRLFDRMEDKNDISWNVIISALAQSGDMQEARALFDRLDHPSVLNWTSMISGYAKNGKLAEAKNLYDRLPVKDTVARTAMMNAYAKNGLLAQARKMFEQGLQHDLVSWNILITCYGQSDQKPEAVLLFRTMIVEGMSPDKRSFTNVIYACEDLGLLRSVHQEAMDAGVEIDTTMLTALFVVYGKCGELDMMKRLFDEKISFKDVVTWTAMITSFGRKRQLDDARHIFECMPQWNLVTWTALVASYAENGSLEAALLLMRQMPQKDIVSTTAVIAAYGRNGYLEDARKLFEETEERDVVLWTAMISAYSANGFDEDAVELFRLMDLHGTPANKTTFLELLNACSNIGSLSFGKIVHEEVVENGLASDVMVRSSIVNMYGKCGSIADAKWAFDIVAKPDSVLCNSMLASYAQNGYLDEAKVMFNSMDKKNSASWNSLFTAYAQRGHMSEAMNLFERMREKDVVTWSGMIAACVKNGEFRKAFRVFAEMDLEGVQANKVTFISVCDACGNLSSLALAKLVHEEVACSGSSADALLWDAVVTMYGRCGNLAVSKALFQNMVRRDSEAWNSLLGSHSHNGKAERVLELFKWMLLDGTRPNKNTFVILLAACSHAGLAQDGWSAFIGMREDHAMEADGDHYACMVDVLARSGRLTDAEELIACMPFEPEALTWTSLLGGCCETTDAKTGGRAAEIVFELEPGNAAPYMMLANLYRVRGT